MGNSRNKGTNIRIQFTCPRGNARPSMPPLQDSSVLKTVPRKYEAGETCEIGEISRCLVSITYLISICWKGVEENESYLRSQSICGINILQTLRSKYTPKYTQLVFAANQLRYAPLFAAVCEKKACCIFLQNALSLFRSSRTSVACFTPAVAGGFCQVGRTLVQ
jgi:hypothetical protein